MRKHGYTHEHARTGRPQKDEEEEEEATASFLMIMFKTEESDLIRAAVVELWLVCLCVYVWQVHSCGLGFWHENNYVGSAHVSPWFRKVILASNKEVFSQAVNKVTRSQPTSLNTCVVQLLSIKTTTTTTKHSVGSGELTTGLLFLLKGVNETQNCCLCLELTDQGVKTGGNAE